MTMQNVHNTRLEFCNRAEHQACLSSFQPQLSPKAVPDQP